jgi:hypothetical protein
MKFLQAVLIILLVLLTLTAPPLTLPAQAQTGSPILKNLLVEVWPEYDRPEVLVIYRAELSPDVTLPATLTFHLPGHIEKMNAVAVEQNGMLVDVAPASIALRRQDNELFVTFSAASPKIQLEYYDTAILTRQNADRQLNFEFLASYPVETGIFEVQEPRQAQNFSLTPAPGQTFTGSDGLTYHTIQVAGLTPPDKFELTATYRRATDQLSVPGAAAPVETPAASNFNLGYLLIAVGVVLLLAAGGYWWGTKRRQSVRRLTGGFCYRCGAVLRDDANFCHACGAERRKN